MKSVSISMGIVFFIASLWALDREGVPPETIARTCGGQFMEVVIQKQQRAQKASQTPTYIDVGNPLIIENWVEEATIPPGLDGRISTFRPPRQIVVAGYLYEVDEAMGDATRSSGRQTTKFSTINDQPTIGTPPSGYRWTGEVRVATRSELVTWRRDWRYVRVKPANAQRDAEQPASTGESK